MKKHAIPALTVLTCCVASTVHAQSATLQANQLEGWLARYEAAWESKDPDAAASLFTADARYHETPFADPFEGREGIGEYWADVTAAQREIDFESEVVAIEGNVGVARWHVTFLAGPDDERVELDGVFVLEFDGALCSELREWWHMGPDAG